MRVIKPRNGFLVGGNEARVPVSSSVPIGKKGKGSKERQSIASASSRTVAAAGAPSITVSRQSRGTLPAGAQPVEQRTATASSSTNTTGTVAGDKHGPEPAASLLQHSGGGPTDQEIPTNEDLGKDNMTSIATTFTVSSDLMEQSPFHSFALHDDKFDANGFPNSTLEFPNFPDPPPIAGNPLFDEKETAFMSSFFDTVDQNASLDHDFQDGLAQWTVPGLDLRKGFEEVWNHQPNLANGATNHTYNSTAFGLPPYEPSTAETHYPTHVFPKPSQPQPVQQIRPQQYNPSAQNFLSHLHNSSHNQNDLQRSVFTHRNQPGPMQCDSPFSAYPSLNMPVGSPGALASAQNTPNSTPKLQNFSFLKNEMSSSESPPATSNLNRIAIPRPPPSNYAPSTSSSSNSPQPSTKPSRKKRRENLSEQQKRLNHITSEQKRRNLIQQGFNEIHSLVPTLRGNRERGDSKSTVLLKTVDYLQELRMGNDRLRRILKHQ